MSTILHTYALIKSLSDEGEDYIDAFWPFVLKVIPHDQPVKIEFIQKQLVEQFNLQIPIHVLNTIVNRAKIKGFLSYSNQKYRLTENGIKFQQKQESEKEVDRKIQSVLEDIRIFFQNNDVILDNDEIKRLLNDFTQKNLDTLVEFFNPTAVSSNVKISKPNSNEALLIRYFSEVETKKPNEYEILNNMVLGSLIYAMVFAPDSQEMVKIKQKKFKDCKVFLDTNFIFSLFELHTPEYNDPANELFELLKKFNFDVRVFSFTINEMSRVLNRYGEEYHCYPSTIRIDTIYSSLKQKGWTKTTSRKFISEIEEHLTQKGITIDWMQDIDLSNYKPKNLNLLNYFPKYKFYQSHLAQNHDVAVIESIQKIRGKDVRKLENSIALFLTSDHGLSKLDLIELNHKEKGTIPEILLDRLLTNILWLTDPKTKISLNTIVAAHSRDLFVKRRVWDRFYKVLQQLKKDQKITEEDISVLLLDGQLENDLIKIEESEVDKITPEFALDEIEKAAQKTKQQQIKEWKIKEREFIDKLDHRIDEVEKQKDEEWLKKLEAIRSNAKNLANKRAKNYILIIKVITAIIILIIIFLFYSFISRLFTLIPVVLFSFAILGISFAKYWEKMYNYFVEKFYKEFEK